MRRTAGVDNLAARTALRRGIALLRQQAILCWDDGAGHTGRAAFVRRRVAANWLSELDLLYGMSLDGGRAGRVALRFAQAAADVPCCPRDLSRLRALKRTREVLRYTHGIVRRPDRRGGETMSLGWYDRHGRHLVRLRPGERIEVRACDLEDVCGFYERLAATDSNP